MLSTTSAATSDKDMNKLKALLDKHKFKYDILSAKCVGIYLPGYAYSRIEITDNGIVFGGRIIGDMNDLENKLIDIKLNSK